MLAIVLSLSHSQLHRPKSHAYSAISDNVSPCEIAYRVALKGGFHTDCCPKIPVASRVAVQAPEKSMVFKKHQGTLRMFKGLKVAYVLEISLSASFSRLLSFVQRRGC